MLADYTVTGAVQYISGSLSLLLENPIIKRDDISVDCAAVLPNIHTSLSPVNRLKLILSGAIHLIGSFPLDAA